MTDSQRAGSGSKREDWGFRERTREILHVINVFKFAWFNLLFVRLKFNFTKRNWLHFWADNLLLTELSYKYTKLIQIIKKLNIILQCSNVILANYIINRDGPMLSYTSNKTPPISVHVDLVAKGGQPSGHESLGVNKWNNAQQIGLKQNQLFHWLRQTYL